MVSSNGSGRRMNIFPPVHIVWAYSDQLVPFISDAFEKLKKKYGNDVPSQVSIVTGPSRTADIEKTLVMGAHGPKELIVVINPGN
jgi:L-lactate dehydrogenase complex protein LldG